MNASQPNFEVQGVPSADGYGGLFLYADSEPPTLTLQRSGLLPDTTGFDLATVSFCLVMNALAAVMLVLPLR